MIIRSLVAPIVIVLSSFAAASIDRAVESPSQRSGPGPRLEHALLHDEHRGGIVLLDGPWPQSAQARSDLWRWDGRRWALVAATDPPATWMAYDRARDRTMLYGGYTCDRETRQCGVVDDTWEWDGARWLGVGEPAR